MSSETRIIKYIYNQNKQYFNYRTLKYLILSSIGFTVSIYTYKCISKYHYRKAISNSISIIEDELIKKYNNDSKQKEKIVSLFNSFLLYPQVQLSIKSILYNLIQDKNIQYIFINITNEIIKQIMKDENINNKIQNNISKIFSNDSFQKSLINISKNIFVQKNSQMLLENFFIDFIQRPNVSKCFNEMIYNGFNNMIKSPAIKDKITDSITNILSSPSIKWKFLKKMIFPFWRHDKDEINV